jgi:hypothetical protein
MKTVYRLDDSQAVYEQDATMIATCKKPVEWIGPNLKKYAPEL